MRYADKLVEQIDSFSVQPVNVVQWFNWFSFDVMGDLAFGHSFGALEHAQSHFAIDIIHSGIVPLGLFSPAPWIINIINSVPSALNPFTKLLRYSEQRVDQRAQMEVPESDILAHLLDGKPLFGDPVADRLLLLGDARVIIVAGSDTTASALVYAFYYLAKYPGHVKELRKELQEGGLGDESLSIPRLRDLQHLNGVINETLRLHPPVPGGVRRDTPPEGLHVNERHIPGGVTILTPNYTIQRCM